MLLTANQASTACASARCEAAVGASTHGMNQPDPQFRALYDAVRTGSPPVEPFFLSATSPQFVAKVREARPKAKLGVVSVFWSRTLVGFYLLLVVLALASATAIGSPEDHPRDAPYRFVLEM